YNLATSDEAGHSENCPAIDANGHCPSAGAQDPSLDADDVGCVPGTDSTLVKIDGCFQSDEDFDGQTYRNDWPGTDPNPVLDQALHPTPVLFTSPLTHGRNYSTIAFETDLPAIEVKGAQANPPFCDRVTGANCVNPPPGAQFYPFFSCPAGMGGSAQSAATIACTCVAPVSVTWRGEAVRLTATRSALRPPAQSDSPAGVPAAANAL